MTDLSSVALPDSPELPAEIQQAIQDVLWRIDKLHRGNRPMQYEEGQVPVWDVTIETRLTSLRSVIAQHLLTAEEAQHLRGVYTNIEQSAGTCAKCADIDVRLRLLSGSSRGEE